MLAQLRKWVEECAVARILWQDAEKRLNRVPQDDELHLANGQVIRSLRELEDALIEMSSDTYARHVSSEKNEFAGWVKTVIGDEQLAKEIEEAHNRPIAAKIIARRIFFLRSQVA
jgi:hypothetical protein